MNPCIIIRLGQMPYNSRIILFANDSVVLGDMGPDVSLKYLNPDYKLVNLKI
jgi:hypothetical protein